MKEDFIKYHKRNFIFLCIEAFFFMFALTMFSQDNVIQLYIYELSNSSMAIALITAIYYGFGYCMYLFAGYLAVRAKSPKFIDVFISFFQRIGFIFIFISTFFVKTNPFLSMLIFFLAFLLYSISRGLTYPLFSQLVSVSIHKDIGLFYGSYSLFGSVGALFASYLIGPILKDFIFPKNFSIIFFIGSIGGILATLALIIGIKEDKSKVKRENIKLSDIFPICKSILKENRIFRRFTIARIIISAIDFVTPYYIIHASNMIDDDVFISGMILIFTISKMLSSIFLGRFTDKYGPINTFLLSVFFGLVGSFMAIFARSKLSFYLLYISISISINAIYLSTDVSCIEYSKGEMTAFYSAISGFLSAPFSLICPFLGVFIERFFNVKAIFIFAILIYIALLIYIYRFVKN